jgi:hypothetical protein
MVSQFFCHFPVPVEYIEFSQSCIGDSCQFQRVFDKILENQQNPIAVMCIRDRRSQNCMLTR